MSKLAKLRKGFASGMAGASISEDDWLHEFLPMIEDAERIKHFFTDSNFHATVQVMFDVQETIHNVTAWREHVDAAIHNNEKEST